MIFRWLQLLSFLALLPMFVSAQSIDAKLAQLTTFNPSANTVPDQLIEVAKHYGIPMGIEWVSQSENERRARVVSVEDGTVMSLLLTILESAPNYSISIKDGVVNISNSNYAADSTNFLNIQLEHFTVKDANVFDAEAALRLLIRRTLHPERYVGGFNGGYGYGVPDPDGFDVETISISGENLTVRDVLDRIVLANGQALWRVNLESTTMMKSLSYFAQSNDRQSENFSWAIVPFGRRNTKD